MIIIDLYIDTNVPSPFLDSPFGQNLISATQVILCNASLELNSDDKLKNIRQFLKKNNFNVDNYEKVNGTNNLLIAKASN